MTECVCQLVSRHALVSSLWAAARYITLLLALTADYKTDISKQSRELGTHLNIHTA